MGQVKIYHDEDNRTYTVTFDLKHSALPEGEGELDYYLLITTDMTDGNGNSFGTTLVKTLEDVPNGYPTATDFSNLCEMWIAYFMDQADLGESSESSSSSSEMYSSESSSSQRYSSESSSSQMYSESSSSQMYSESSSSQMYSESSSSQSQ